MNPTLRWFAQALLLLVAVSSQGVQAEEDRSWAVSGFGTIGAVRTNTDDARFRSNTRQSSGAGKSPAFGVDSRLGLQGNVKFNDTFSAVGQLLTINRDGLTAQAEWLYGEASVTPWLNLRLGRMVLPIFLDSDSRNVGYSTHWVRPPLEVYNLFPASSFDGAQAQVHVDWGNSHVTLQGSLGTSQVNVDIRDFRSNVDLNKLYSLVVSIERGDWILRLGNTEAHNTRLGFLPLAPFTDSFRGAGVGFDNGKFLLQAEYVARRTSSGGFFNQNAYYVTAGYRMGNWTPYGTVSRYEPRGGLAGGDPSTRTLAAGVRWDVMRNVALKAQIESTEKNRGNFVDQTPAFAANARKVNVFTLLVDFVF